MFTHGVKIRTKDGEWGLWETIEKVGQRKELGLIQTRGRVYLGTFDRDPGNGWPAEDVLIATEIWKPEDQPEDQLSLKIEAVPTELLYSTPAGAQE